MPFYETADDAAIAALNEANPLSIRHNREYRGIIFRTAEGTFGYTMPLMGGTYGTNLANIVIPPNTTEVGHYHTHGDYTGPVGHGGRSERTDREHAWRSADIFGKTGPTADIFGPEDIPLARQRGRGIPGYRSYLGTARGVYLYYDVTLNAVGELPRRTPRIAR